MIRQFFCCHTICETKECSLLLHLLQCIRKIVSDLSTFDLAVEWSLVCFSVRVVYCDARKVWSSSFTVMTKILFLFSNKVSERFHRSPFFCI